MQIQQMKVRLRAGRAVPNKNVGTYWLPMDGLDKELLGRKKFAASSQVNTPLTRFQKLGYNRGMACSHGNIAYRLLNSIRTIIPDMHQGIGIKLYTCGQSGVIVKTRPFFKNTIYAKGRTIHDMAADNTLRQRKFRVSRRLDRNVFKAKGDNTMHQEAEKDGNHNDCRLSQIAQCGNLRHGTPNKVTLRD